MSDEYDVFFVAESWLPDESKKLVKVTAIIDNFDCAYIEFDNEYELYISKQAVKSLYNIIGETLEAFEKDHFKSGQEVNNVLHFKRNKDK
tara:strand:+ start:551 stop:820 length:270 start_codon:yes stop_codon:yes gene_type:complete